MQTVLNHPLFMPILVTLVTIAAFPLVAGYIVLVERKVLADFQVRLGPMRVGPHGLLQPIADALKLLLKEDIIPEGSDKGIFWFAPCISTITALTRDGRRLTTTQRSTLPDLPGVGAFFVRGRSFTLPAGVDLFWKTIAVGK